MNRENLDNYCKLLKTEIFEKDTVYKILEKFKYYLPKVKSEILTNCLNFEVDKKIEYLNFVSSEINSLNIIKSVDSNLLEKWLKLFDISFSTVLNSNIDKQDIHIYLDSDYAAYEEEEFDVIKRKDIFKFQETFFYAFRHHFSIEIINFCIENKSNFSKKTSEVTNIHKSFKDEYLIAFKKAIIDEKQIKETCFDLVYQGIIHYVPYLENEVMENLLLLNTDKKDDYLNFAIDTLKKTEFSDYNEEVIAKWLEKYNSPISEFPHFKNEELKHWLNRYYNGYADDPKDYDFILDIQIDFYCYAAGLEAQKMIAFLESKKSTALKSSDNQSPTYEKLKWIF